MNTVAPCLRASASSARAMAPSTVNSTPAPAKSRARGRPGAGGRGGAVGRPPRETRQPVAKPRLGVTRLGVLPGGVVGVLPLERGQRRRFATQPGQVEG